LRWRCGVDDGDDDRKKIWVVGWLSKLVGVLFSPFFSFFFYGLKRKRISLPDDATIAMLILHSPQPDDLLHEMNQHTM
jgi:hypothetical protein